MFLNACVITSRKKVIISDAFSGYSDQIRNDTLIYPEMYKLDELHLYIHMYDYIAVEDSIHLFFQSLFSQNCANFVSFYTFNKIDDDKLKLKKGEFLFPNISGIFKLVIPLQDTTLNIAIYNFQYGYAFASYEIKIE